MRDCTATHNVHQNLFNNLATRDISSRQQLRETYDKYAAKNGGSPLLLTAAVAAGKSTIDTAYDIPQISQWVHRVLKLAVLFVRVGVTDTTALEVYNYDQFVYIRGC